MPIIKEEQTVDVIGSTEYLDEEATQALIDELKAYADAELASNP